MTRAWASKTRRGRLLERLMYRFGFAYLPHRRDGNGTLRYRYVRLSWWYYNPIFGRVQRNGLKHHVGYAKHRTPASRCPCLAAQQAERA